MMKTGSKAMIGSMVFILLCAVGLVLSNDNHLWDVFYYVREHLFIIGLLLLISDYVFETMQLTLIYGLVLYKIELVIFNICLAFMPREEWYRLSTGYDIAVKFTLSIWIILFICLIIRKRL